MHHPTVRLPLLLALGLLVACSSGPPEPATGPEIADLVLRGGKILTLDDDRPTAEALAIRSGKVLATGTEEEIAASIGEGTRVVDLEGAVAMPGFVEGHGHFLIFGDTLNILDLTRARNWPEIVALVEAAAEEAEPGQWIRGRGWHQDKWDATPEDAVEGVPVHGALSAVSPENPVFLEHASGHGAIANAAAMARGGVTSETPDPEGGTIVRTPSGEPTGYFRETAQRLVELYEPTEADLREAARLASEASLAHGVTSFQDAGTPIPQVRFLRGLAAEGGLGVRLWVMIRDDPAAIRAALPEIAAVREADAHFTVGGIKHSIDGALGSHGAWLLEPYTDLPSTSGLNTIPIATIEESARIALEHDLQLCVHAIGDRANRETLDLFERIAGDEGEDLASRRWRIEHAQHLDPDDVPRFGELGIVASVQGVHCTSDGPWVPTRIGEERAEEGAYVWRKLLDSGALVSNGTDVPVEPIDPIANYYSTVTRRMGNGEAFHPGQVMTRDEALRSMTLWAAEAAFEEDVKGSLEPGKLADVVVLSRDLTTVPEEEILDTEILMTIVGGEIRYERPAGS